MPRFAAVILTSFTVVVALAPSFAWAQAPKAGVVTTLEGNVTATRATAAPQPLRFKDDVFLQDKIATGEQSLARMLLGGKAVVTVRERSVLTITEVPGRSTIEIDSGKFALAVARERMRPGEVIEIRTPNAIAGVRGSVIVTEVETPPGAATPASSLYVLQGNLEAQPRNPATRAAVGTPQTVNVNQQFRVVGLLSTITVIRPDQLGPIRAGLQPKSKPGNTAQGEAQLKAQQQQTAVALAATLSSPGGTSAIITPTPPPSTPTTAESPNAVAPIQPVTDEALTALAKGQVPGVSSTSTSSTGSTGSAAGALTGNALTASKVPLVGGLLTNPGFETGNLNGWTLTGGGGVISSFGSLTPREGNSMALIHTNNSQTPTTLTQAFNATKSILTVSARGYLLSNEFPTFTSQNSAFNDRFLVELVNGSQTFTLFDARVNDVNFSASPFSATAAGFSLSQGAGISSFDLDKKTQVITPGSATIRFSVANVADSALQSAFIVDAVEILQDPPLFFITSGHFAPSGTLHTVVNASQTHDSLLFVCCGGSASLAGPALYASNSDVTFPFSVVSAIQGGHITSSSTDPLIVLEGGRYTLGPIVTVFDVAGSGGNDQPLQHAGTFLDATNASINTGNVMIVDSALLSASAPLLNLKTSTLTTNDTALSLAFRANVTSLGPLFALDKSRLIVGNGALVSVRNGSSLFVNGDLVRLANGSTLSLMNGPLVSVSGNSLLSVSGGLVSFVGGGNTLNVNNNLCSVFGCTNIGGLNVALTGGATAANVSINTPIKGAGAVNIPASAAAVVVSGAGKVNVGN